MRVIEWVATVVERVHSMGVCGVCGREEEEEEEEAGEAHNSCRSNTDSDVSTERILLAARAMSCGRQPASPASPWPAAAGKAMKHWAPSGEELIGEWAPRGPSGFEAWTHFRNNNTKK